MNISPVRIARIIGTVLQNMNMEKRRNPLSFWFLSGIAGLVTLRKIFQQYIVLTKKGMRIRLWKFSRLKKPPRVILPSTPL